MSSVEINIKGYGHEFQWHQVNKDTLKEMLADYKKGKIELLMEKYFTGGNSLDGEVFSGAYGCGIDSSITVDGVKIKITKKKPTQIFDDTKPNLEGADFYFITQGNIEGTGEIQLKNKKFDLKLLDIDYVEFNVMQSGTIITSIKYDGEPISISYEDSGVDYRHQLLTYDADDEGNVGVFQSLFYDEEDEIFKFIADDIKQVLKKKQYILSINIPVLDSDEWWASQAIDDTDSVIRSLLELTNSCIELKIKLEDANQLHAELSLHNTTHNIELETNKWLAFCISLRETEMAEMANAVENKLIIFVSKYLKNRR